MSDTTAFITGTWVDADGNQKKCDHVSVSVTRIGMTFHIDVEESGRGSVTMTGIDGRGKFTTRNGRALTVVFEMDRDVMRYRLLDGLAQVAVGTVYDLPP
jgi:hypothetical protein